MPEPNTALKNLSKRMGVSLDLSEPQQRQLAVIFFRKVHAARSKSEIAELENNINDICPQAGIKISGVPHESDVIRLTVGDVVVGYKVNSADVNAGLVALHLAQAMQNDPDLSKCKTPVSVTVDSRPTTDMASIRILANAKGPEACYPLAVTVKRREGSSLEAEASDEALSMPSVVHPLKSGGFVHAGGTLSLRAHIPTVIADRLLIHELRELGYIQ